MIITNEVCCCIGRHGKCDDSPSSYKYTSIHESTSQCMNDWYLLGHLIFVDTVMLLFMEMLSHTNKTIKHLNILNLVIDVSY